MMSPNDDHLPDELEARLLQAGRNVHMSPEARDKTLAALGVGTVGLTAAATSKASALGSLSSKGAALWMFGGAATIGIAAAVAVFSSQSTSESDTPVPIAPKVEPKRAIPTTTPERPAEPAARAPAPQLDGVEARDSEEASKVPSKESSIPKATAPNEPMPATDSSLTEELEELGRVEQALRAGQPVRALSLLSKYRKTFDKPQLGLEAEVLSIQALAESGNRGEAARRAERFIQRNPSSPLATRARKYTGQDAPR